MILLFICNLIYLIVHIGIDLRSKTIELEGVHIKLQIWDISGRERHEKIVEPYYTGAMVNVLSYSITPISHSFLHLSGTLHMHTCQ